MEKPSDEYPRAPSTQGIMSDQIAALGSGKEMLATKSKRNAPTAPEKEPGKSLFPFSRVQKILKADKELPLVAREAAFILSLAAEEFIKSMAEESSILASRENRVTVQYRDLASVVRKIEKFMFLDEVIAPEAPVFPRRKSKVDREGGKLPSLLENFLAKNEGAQNSFGEDIVMNEDGTMSIDP